jgi:hypothetical protein
VEAPIPLMYTCCTDQSLAVWLLALSLSLYGQVVESLHDDTGHGFHINMPPRDRGAGHTARGAAVVGYCDLDQK